MPGDMSGFDKDCVRSDMLRVIAENQMSIMNVLRGMLSTRIHDRQYLDRRIRETAKILGMTSNRANDYLNSLMGEQG